MRALIPPAIRGMPTTLLLARCRPAPLRAALQLAAVQLELLVLGVPSSGGKCTARAAPSDHMHRLSAKIHDLSEALREADREEACPLTHMDIFRAVMQGMRWGPLPAQEP